MSLLHILVLAVVQGITEFLPISSSGHLVLLPALTGWPDQGLMVDVAAHFGSLLATLVYFWRDIARLVVGFVRLVAVDRGDRDGRLALYIGIATVPAVAFGLVIKEIAPGGIRSVELIAWNAIGFGILLYLADRFGATLRAMRDLGLGGAFFIGCAQALALIPGTSRSGITMTAARFLGLGRFEAARFSFLLSVPAVAGASLLEGLELMEFDDMALAGDAALSAALTFVAALAAIAWLMRWLRSSSFTPFVIYRLILGTGLLVWVYAG
ncbi:MAG: undecaprenyl-diphosphate phosphatase [Alphaproteobacteria bacterium]|nr:undecaprenyl-diphosphate phosphatase [Alphaproteobacteria bacterium]